MKQRMKRLLTGLLAASLLLSLFLTPAAALTPEQLRELLQAVYIDEIDDAVLSEETIEGMLETLGDPYTRYMSADEFALFLASMADEEFGGIGISAGPTEEGYEIATVYDKLPAKAAGLVPGDIITAVNGVMTEGVSADIVSGWLRGEVGSSVTLTVKHADGTVITISIKRELVVIPKTVSERIGKMGYISCSAFGPETLGHFKAAIEKCKDASFWVIDMRNNGGGDVNATVQSLGLFLGEGVVTIMRNGRDEYTPFLSVEKSQTMEPMMVLTSPWTASAAEIFSGVVRDSGSGLLIGETTYGKGVAQIIVDKEAMPEMFSEGDAVSITAFRYYTRAGANTADKIGIIPHVLVNAEIAGNIALMLCTEETESGNLLRLKLGGWRWYLNLDKATASDTKPYFTELLEALPPGTDLNEKKNGVWTPVGVNTLVERYQLADYASRAFTDVGSGELADKINTLACYNILRGYGGGEFHPAGNMTRAEFCSLLVQSMGLKSTGTAPFDDISPDAWYASAVSAVYSAGLMNGVGNGRFDPEGTVSNEQLITVMSRAATFLNAGLYNLSKRYDAAISTVPAAFSDWAKSSVWLLDESLSNELGAPLSLLYNSAADINPAGAATRAEAAELLFNIYTHLGILNV